MDELNSKKAARATADLVAREANVSRVAVSRAFNPNASLKPEKRDRILQVARELNYTPDMAARSLVTRRSHLVGMIVPDVCSPWESQEIDALTTALQAEGFATLLFKAKADFSMDQTLLTYMRGFNPDSVIAFTENIAPDVLTGFLDRAVPIYVIYDDATEFSGKPASSIYDRLLVRQREGIEQAVALLQGYGARRVAYLGGKQQSLANNERERMITEILAERGMEPPIVVAGDYTYDTAYRATLDLFRVGDGADAIFAANDVGAFGAIDALRHDLGLSVPGDVKVVGFDDIPQAHWKSYNLTTVRIDLEDRVRALVRLILRRLKTPDADPMVETLGTRLVVRGTVG
ncbi:LacI family DNA-binding transcriptional regulator [Agrobacterium sp. O3.4]|uniref:LacI family DNA-binding transcriptional regulator n=1 Tax=Agrobacterium cucumeris TaxID=2862866 RepID=A0ABY8RUG5_9HYPH|nr:MULTISPECIES: LacI family DNA-binding transcriptional regulator [Rhizobium/Agrobacterium group]MCZ7471000.1 LacI family DNA-binding transcriptional regulator [Rhizobium rhizogenes]MCZ7488585.1 LacI family DNA-binding transcriptional regulator [Rhizobium rhizogenes]MRH97020.1 substrate-binding domain-containing protein [Agrobacterium tumefaciens]WCK22167.1 LacI family DNA-binding transcriptional regulator [Agrobacterium tumefaciens]WHO10758.1 LacI family DNA-binding transcriptional regulator